MPRSAKFKGHEARLDEMNEMIKKTLFIYIVFMGFIPMLTHANDQTSLDQLSFDIPKMESKPLVNIGKTADDPEVNLYISELEKKIQAGLEGKRLPLDFQKKKGNVVLTLRIILQKNGNLNEAQLWPSSEVDRSVSYDAVNQVLTKALKRAGPYPRIPPGLYAGYELIAFDTNLEVERSKDDKGFPRLRVTQ